MRNLQLQQQFWMKECDILGGQNILWPLLHIVRRGSGPPTPDDLRPCFRHCSLQTSDRRTDRQTDRRMTKVEYVVRDVAAGMTRWANSPRSVHAPWNSATVCCWNERSPRGCTPTDARGQTRLACWWPRWPGQCQTGRTCRIVGRGSKWSRCEEEDLCLVPAPCQPAPRLPTWYVQHVTHYTPRCVIGLSHARHNLAFPVTYLAKTRQNLLWSAAMAGDDIDWSTLLSILPTLTDEEDVSAGRRRFVIA